MNDMELFDKYGQQYELLKELFGSRISQFPRHRLNEIFNVTEHDQRQLEFPPDDN